MPDPRRHRGPHPGDRECFAAALLPALQRAAEDYALPRSLLDAGVAAFRPWRPGCADGVWQLVPLPRRPSPTRARCTLAAADVLRNLGFTPD
jgi:hypothetical protein